MANFKDRYQEYLESPEWDELRKEAYKMADYRCELCHSVAAAVHHVKYPKRYKEDCLENLVVVCDRCHRRLHGLWDPLYDFPGLTEGEERFVAVIAQKHIKTLKRLGYAREGDLRKYHIFGCRLLKALKINMLRVD